MLIEKKKDSPFSPEADDGHWKTEEMKTNKTLAEIPESYQVDAMECYATTSD